MKLRDVVLLLIGGGLVVFGILVGDLLENDAFADGHGSKSVEYEYAMVDASSNTTSHRFFYYQTSSAGTEVQRVKTVEHGKKLLDSVGSRSGTIYYPGEYVIIMNKFYAPQGWIIDTVTASGKYQTLIIKRVKK